MPASSYKFGDYELDCGRFELRRDGRPVRLERIPMDLLVLLVEGNGHVVTRQEIGERLWGKGVFVDTEHGINTAILKIRRALRDDPERPRFIQTVAGKGYRFTVHAEHDWALLALAAEPRLDPLRRDPRYRELSKKLGWSFPAP
jgi:DNA-binding winged helix-turn-helix (wHTH) protein